MRISDICLLAAGWSQLRKSWNISSRIGIVEGRVVKTVIKRKCVSLCPGEIDPFANLVVLKCLVLRSAGPDRRKTCAPCGRRNELQGAYGSRGPGRLWNHLIWEDAHS